MEYGMLAVGGTLPSSAEVTAVDDAIHENEDYIELVDPNRLGGMVARRALKLYVVKVPPPPSVPVAERYENGKKRAYASPRVRAAAAAAAAPPETVTTRAEQPQHLARVTPAPPLSVSRPQTRRAVPGRAAANMSDETDARLPAISNSVSAAIDESLVKGCVSSPQILSAATAAELAERVDSDMKLNADILSLNARRAASVVGTGTTRLSHLNIHVPAFSFDKKFSSFIIVCLFSLCHVSLIELFVSTSRLSFGQSITLTAPSPRTDLTMPLRSTKTIR